MGSGHHSTRYYANDAGNDSASKNDFDSSRPGKHPAHLKGREIGNLYMKKYSYAITVVNTSFISSFIECFDHICTDMVIIGICFLRGQIISLFFAIKIFNVGLVLIFWVLYA